MSLIYVCWSLVPFPGSAPIIILFSGIKNLKTIIMTKTKRLLIPCLFLFGATALKAQSGTVSSGGEASGGGGSVSYSIGQIDYITENGAGGTITQGLQQPYEILVITGVENKEIDLSVSVYPNPTADQVTLNVISFLNMSYILTDIQGKLVKQNKLTSNETQINMSELNKATYLIKVLSNNKEVKTFKVIKN
jgi:hypothetical protein